MAKLAVRILLAVVIATTTAMFLPISGMRPAIAQVADPVIIRSGLHNGYGRIVLQWNEPVDYTAEIIGDQLVVRFDQPLVASLRGVLTPVSRYISDAFFDPDGRTVAFVLSDNFEVRAFNVGSNVVLDILDKPEAQPAPAAVPTPPVRPAQSDQNPQITPAPTTPVETVADEGAGLAELDVRVGRHPTFYRLVFDWPNRTDYTLEGAQGSQTIAFGAPARINATDISRRLPQGVRVRQDGTNPLDVVVETTPARQLRHFRSGNKVVVDIMGVQRAPATTTAQTRPAETPDAEAAPAPPAPAAPAATAQTGQADDAPADAATEAANADTPAAEDGELDPNSPEALALAAQNTENTVRTNGQAPIERESIGDLVVTVDQTATELSLDFPFGQPGGAAVWSRAGFLWLAFDVRANLNLDSVRQQAAQIIGVVEQIESPYATIVRMTIPEGIGLYTTQSDNGDWRVTMQQGIMQPVEKLGPSIELDEQTRARLIVPLGDVGPIIPIEDPEVGDTLRVTTTTQNGYGIEVALRYPEFEVLPSVQGVVVAPMNDSVQVAGRDDGRAVIVTAEDGLNISPEGARLLASATGVRDGTGEGREGLIFELDDWRRGGLDNYNKVIRGLRRKVAESGDEHRNKARLDLAQYYLANGLGPEADAVITAMEHDDPLIAQRLQFRALKAAVKFLNRDYEEAERLLEDERLREIPEMQLWRAVTLAARGRPNEGARDLLESVHILDYYPPELLSRIVPIATEQALIVGNPEAGMDMIEKMLVTPGLSESKIMDIQYLKGIFEEEAGELEQAVATWDQVAEGENRKARAHAIFDRTELLMRLERLTVEDAIEQLQKLRFAWRGDAFEMALLKRIGELQIENKDFRDGLNTLRQVAIFFPNMPVATEATDMMHKTFENLYLGDEINNISAIKAVALYDEFRELTPAGEKGDELIRRLADRMVDVELFERAEELLEHQVNFRLSGVEKARVGARLALVYLLDSKPEETIRTIDETEEPGISDELATQRRHLRARALLDTDRGAEAVASLEGDYSRNAELLRIDHYRNKRDYMSAAETFQRLVGDEPFDENGVSDERGRYMLNWAVNLAMAGQERTLNMLKRRYGEVMAQSPYAEAFSLITSSPTQGLIDYRTLSDRVDEVEEFKGFLATYRDQLEKSQLSAIN
ncbi:tetratricopeptide repeat protein [Thalassospira sp. HF15]|uniref:tetratricopeptide repeat protein n=1 Tax=Thalassospira sp. HF15 TaxID=2722755 RepID=UPI0014311C67|nr:tetratricopeptide repeat protein [Thalassospira sp. HF15]NIY76793.1 tetratricopeptide repeat protein [Thalassospira sp. HF15]